jgi:hypothetical protein
VESGALKEAQLTTIQNHFNSGIEATAQEICRHLYLFPFLIARLLEYDYPSAHRLYSDETLNILESVENTHQEVQELEAAITTKSGGSQRGLEAKKVDAESALSCLLHDFKLLVDSNMLLACVFYTHIFDGYTRLERKLQSHRPAEPYLDHIVGYLVDCLAKGNKRRRLPIELPGHNQVTPLIAARRFVKLLTGRDYKDMRAKYNRGEKKPNPLRKQ